MFRNTFFVLIVSILLFGCLPSLGPNLKPGIELSNRGKKKSALTYYESQLVQYPSDKQLFSYLTTTSLEAHDVEKAKGYFRQAIELGVAENELSEMCLNISLKKLDYAMGKDNWDEAKMWSIYLNREFEDSNESKYATIMMTAYGEMNKGGHKQLWESIADFAKASAYSKNSGIPYYMMAKARLKLSKTDLEPAILDMTKAKTIEPNGAFIKDLNADLKLVNERKKKMEAFWGK
jgi:tetratricopeptide (TPR) repeat protein